MLKAVSRRMSVHILVKVNRPRSSVRPRESGGPDFLLRTLSSWPRIPACAGTNGDRVNSSEHFSALLQFAHLLLFVNDDRDYQQDQQYDRNCRRNRPVAVGEEFRP